MDNNNNQFYNNINQYPPNQQMNYQMPQYQQNFVTPQIQQQFSSQIPKSSKKKQKKKKKKGRFCLILLILILVVVGCIFGKKGLDKIAQKKIEEFTTGSPFSFREEDDAIWYVTNDFQVPTKISYNDKNYKVSWESSNENLVEIDKSGLGKVNRPNEKGTHVTITQIYRFLFGKGTLTYTLTLIPTNTLSKEDVSLISLDDLKNDTYGCEMEVEITNDGVVNYMYGDFNNTYVYSKEDALVVLDAYRDTLGLSQDFTFTFDKVDKGVSSIAYIYDVYYNGIRLDGEEIRLLTNLDTFEVIKISNGISSKVDNLPVFNETIDTKTIIENYIQSLNKNMEYIILENDTIYYEEVLYDIYYVVFEDDTIINLVVDINEQQIYQEKTMSYSTDMNPILPAPIQGVGKNELWEDVTFDISYTYVYDGLKPKNLYILSDASRYIHCYKSMSFYDSLKEDEIYHLPDLYTLANDGVGHAYISSENKVFNDTIAVGVYKNAQDIYDVYRSRYGYLGMDGKQNDINIIANYDTTDTDNAGYSPFGDYIFVFPKSYFKHSSMHDIETFAHEYNHGITRYKTGLSFTFNKNLLTSGISEAYSDTMACLMIEDSNWLIVENYVAETGEYFCGRDIINFNNEHMREKDRCAYYYEGEYWSTDPHKNSVIISHVAYEMSVSDYFTKEETGDIWFESWDYGYSNKSTYVDVRKAVIQAANELGYGKVEQDFIAYQFDLVGILDPYYLITSEEILNLEKQPLEDVIIQKDTNTTVIKTKSKAITGNPFLDDETTTKFLIVTSPLGAVFGDEPILIYQLENGATKEEIATIQSALNDYASSALGEDISVTITYQQVDEKTFEICEKFIGETTKKMKQATFDTLGIEDDENDESVSFFKQILDLILYYNTFETTAYDFYEAFGFVDYYCVEDMAKEN